MTLRLLAALLLAAPLAAADPPPPAWQGVWAGTVGTLPVRACLAKLGDGESVGAYFYLSRLRTITLTQAGDSRVWTEGEADPQRPPPPRWTFAAIAHDRLAGSWSDGRRTLAFQLTRVASKDEDEPCGTDAFNAPRFGPLAVKRGRGMQDGVAYTTLHYTAAAFPDIVLDGFALIGDDPVTRRLNAGLAEQVPGTDWRACMAGELAAHGADGAYEASLVPTMITPRWLAATLTDADDCGGAHPNTATVPFTFDRKTGAAVKLESWLSDAALKREKADGYDLTTLRPALKRLTLARAGDQDADCRDAFANEDFWHIGLDRRGLSFTPELPHVEAACVDTTLVPWAALAPYLTAAGKAGRASLSR